MEKLTCKDLMVGDQVYYKSKTKDEYKIGTVNLIRNDNYLQVDYCDTEIDNVKPIQLTAEILEKKGFSLVAMPENFPYKVFDSEDKRIQVCDISNSGEGYWNVHIDNEDFSTIGSCDVRYVHEMQHLFNLCKYEKEITL